MKRVWSFAVALAALVTLAACGERDARELPHFVSENGRHAFMVDGAPFLMLAGQANNSSNYASMLPEVWPAIEQMHANTLIMPVAWEQVEPVEGEFDFSFVDTLIEQARDHEVRLVLLWFATWKNTSASYAPAWVKQNPERFPHMMTREGAPHYPLSPHGAETLAADSRAFARLMAHIRDVDAAQQTVIMMQVQNEPGSYRLVRDYSPAAQAIFDAAIPAELAAAMNVQGTWAEAFGANADEYFQAWHVAHYINAVAEAGRAEYNLPTYANAALRDPVNYQDPATYASGGPTWNVIDIWHAAAPSIDVLAPDIYARDYPTVMAHLDGYARADNPLMLVEIGNDMEYARYFFSVMGRHGVGFAPFGTDFTGYSNYPLGARDVNEEAIAHFAQHYALLAPIARDWARISFENEVWGVSKPTDGAKQTVSLDDDWQAIVSYDDWQFGMAQWFGPEVGKPEDLPRGGALIAKLGENDFLITGLYARVTLERPQGETQPNSMMRVEEGTFENGEWVMRRVWNGDQTDYGLNFTNRAQVLRVRMMDQ